MSGEVYVLLYTENSDNRCGADIFVYGDVDRAQEKLEELYRESLKNLGHDEDTERDDYRCFCGDKYAVIAEGYDSYIWTIETQKIL